MCEVWHLVRRKNNAYPQILVYGRNSRTGRHTACPLLGVKRTLLSTLPMSAFDPGCVRTGLVQSLDCVITHRGRDLTDCAVRLERLARIGP